MARFSRADAEAVRAGLALVDAGLPLGELLDLGRRTDVAVREVADHAVDAFLRFVRDPVRGTARDDAEATERLVTAYRVMLPATERLVAHHTRRRLLAAAAEQIAAQAPDERRGRGVTLRVVTRRLDDDRPLLDLPPGRPTRLAWVRRGEGLVGWGVAARVGSRPGRGPVRPRRGGVRRARSDARTSTTRWASRAAGSPRSAPSAFDADAAGSALVVPRVLVGRRDGVTWLTTVDPDGAEPAPGPATAPPVEPARDRPRFAGSSKPDLRWLEAVATAVDRLRGGELDKVVLARDHAVWSAGAVRPAGPRPSTGAPVPELPHLRGRGARRRHARAAARPRR